MAKPAPMERLDLETWLKAVETHPDDPRAWQAVGVAWLERARASEATRAFVRAVTLDPTLEPAVEGLVAAARQARLWDAAVPALARSQTPAARLGLALAAFEQGDMATAADGFRAVLAAVPDHAEAAYNLAAALANAAQWDEAAQAFERFTQLRPNEVSGWRGLGRARSAQRQHAEAVEAWRRAVHLGGDAAACHLPLGKALGDLGQWEEAAGVLREATRINAQSAPAFIALAFAYDRMARGEGVRDPKWTRERCLRAEAGALQAALRLDDENPGTWRSLARAREALGDAAGARDAAGRASAASRARDLETHPD